MTFDLTDGVLILRRTPGLLRMLVEDLPCGWNEATEGPGSWSAFDVVGHLIHGERTDWVPRVEHILHHGDAVPFPPFDREAMFEASKGKTIGDLLDIFAELRNESLRRLQALNLTDKDLERHGRHPEFGQVLLGQHLATWVVHDLTHISQIVRVLARQYSDAVGPWRAYLSVLR